MRLLLCLLLSLCKVSKAGSWLYPYPTPTNPETWYIGETKQLWWETTLDNYWMNIKQQSMSDSTGKAIIFREYPIRHNKVHMMLRLSTIR